MGNWHSGKLEKGKVATVKDNNFRRTGVIITTNRLMKPLVVLFKMFLI